MTEDMEKGVQPLDALMTKLNFKNSDLVEHSTKQLSHKVVAKGRKGRRLTLNAQLKIMKALNKLQSEKRYSLDDLFNYPGKD
jgi:hypothetical protein